MLSIAKTIIIYLWLGAGGVFLLLTLCAGAIDAIGTIDARKKAILSGEPKQPGDMHSWWHLLRVMPICLFSAIAAGLGALLMALPLVIVLGLLIILIEWFAK
jgi:hypothetical protein